MFARCVCKYYFKLICYNYNVVMNKGVFALVIMWHLFWLYRELPIIYPLTQTPSPFFPPSSYIGNFTFFIASIFRACFLSDTLTISSLPCLLATMFPVTNDNTNNYCFDASGLSINTGASHCTQSAKWPFFQKASAVVVVVDLIRTTGGLGDICSRLVHPSPLLPQSSVKKGSLRYYLDNIQHSTVVSLMKR